MDEPASDAEKEEEEWERRLKQIEQRRRITIFVFLGIVFAGLVVWWGWGKLFHRERKL